MQLQAQPSINDARTQAHLALGARLPQIDLTPLLVYRIDSVPASALPALAWQFDVLSPLWQLLAPGGGSVQQSGTQAARDLIKLAISLHRSRGTPYAIKTALAALGWPGVTILEGQSSWGGSFYPANQGWAVFRVQVPVPAINITRGVALWNPSVSYKPGDIVWLVFGSQTLFYVATGTPAVGVPPQYASFDVIQNVDLITNWDELLTYGWTPLGPAPTSRPVTAADVTAITQAVLFFKNARSWFDSPVFVFPGESDALIPAPSDVAGGFDYLKPAPSDQIAVTFAGVTDSYALARTHNAHYQRAGARYSPAPLGPSDGATTFNGVPVEGNK